MITLLELVLCGYAFFMPVTISGAEPFAYLAVALWAWLLYRGKLDRPNASPLGIPILVFISVAVLASLMGTRPGYSLSKLDRLLMLGVVFVMPSVFFNRDGVIKLVTCFVTGSIVKGIYDIFRVPSAVLGGLPLFQTGNMREPQIYAVSLCFVAAALVIKAWTLKDKSVLLALLVTAAGLVLHFKRGAWFAFLVAACVMAWIAGRRRVILVILLCAAGLFVLPVARERMSMIRQEFSVTMKGRYPIWTRAAPKLIKKYPFGMGWKAPRYEDLRAETRFVNRKLNHLHNNALEITLELGWLGIAAWLYWMGTAAVLMIRNFLRARRQDPKLAALSLGVLGGFVVLMLNGVVEYNFGDAEIFMVLCFLMGLSAVIANLERLNPSGDADPAPLT